MSKRSLLQCLIALLLVIAAAAPAVAAVDTTAGTSADALRVNIEWQDMLIIAVYLIGIVALGCWAGTRRRESQGSDYFLASKSLTWPVIGLALFATNISTIHLVSFAQNGFTSGLTYGNYEWMAAFTLVILSLFFAPFYLRSGVATLPDFMEKRFSRGSRDYLAILSIFSAIVVHIGFSLHTGAIVLEGTVLEGLGIANPERYHAYTIIALCGVTAIYTIVGGLLAVVLTESIQTVVLLLGAICITVIGFNMIGGWNELKETVHPVNLSMLRSGSDPTGVTWYAVFLGYPVLGVWYWCTDQTIVQRVLGAKDENHARIGPLFAGFIKILPVFLFVLPGVICLALVNKGVEHGGIPPLPAGPDGSPLTERTYTHMIKEMLAPGVRGIVIAALLAALMSTVSGALNSIATLFSYDIYKRFKPAAEDRHLVHIGRLATFVAMCVAIVWSMVIGALGETIFQAMVDVFPVVAPPTAVVFLWGVFWRRTSSRAALWTLIGGSLFGMVLYVLNMLDKFDVISLKDINPHLASFLAINALFMSFILFVAESVFIVVVSLLWPHRHTAESEALVWRTPWEALKAENAWRGLLDFRILSAVLVVTMIALYIWFSIPVAYYPITGEVTLGGDPVSGAIVVLEADDPTFDARLSTGVDGRYAYATKQRAGGAPAGTHYRVAVVPDRDFIVRLSNHGAKKKVEVLASLPPGTPVQRADTKDREALVCTVDGQERHFDAGPDEHVEVRRVPDIPARYRDPDRSGLEFTVTGNGEEESFSLSTP